MAAGINRTTVDVMKDLRKFLLAMYAISNPNGASGVDYEVVAGQQSLVPQPAAENYVVMHLLGNYQMTLAPIALNQDDVDPIDVQMATPMEYAFRLDIYGGLAQSFASVVRTLFFSPYGYRLFREIGAYTVPLSCQDEHYSPFDKNGEINYDPRHILNVSVQSNAVVTVPQDYFNVIGLEVHGVT